MYNVVDTMDPDAGVQVFDSSHFLFEKELAEAARDEAPGEGLMDYTDPDEGASVSFRATEITKGTFKFLEYKSFGFVLPRREPVIKDDLDAAISFDEILKLHTPAEIEAIMYGEPEEEDTPPARGSRAEEAPARGARTRPTPPVEEEDDDDDATPPPATEPARSSRRGAAAVQEDPPARSSRRAAQNDPDPTPAPSRKSAPKKATPDCPSGHVFGTDNDEYDECNTCELWDACARAQSAS